MAAALLRLALAGLAAVWAQEGGGDLEGTCPAGGCAEGLQMPKVIIGCWQLLERNKNKDHAVKALQAYAEAGFTAFDTADIYGPSEGILGEFRRKWAAANPGAPPLRFYTKYVTDAPGAQEADRINAQSRRNLGVEALDMVQFHWWSLKKDGSATTFLKAGRELTRLKGEGKILHLAGCNMDTTHLKLLVDDGMAIESNQVQYSMVDRRPEVSLLKYCKERGIKLAVFGVVAGGILSEEFLGLSQSEAKGRLRSVSQRMYWSSLQRWSTSWDLFQKLLEVMKEIGDKQKPRAPIAAVACAWVLRQMKDKGAGGSLIIGIRDATHLEEHKALLRDELTLSDLDMWQIQSVLGYGKRPTTDIWYEERGWAQPYPP